MRTFFISLLLLPIVLNGQQSPTAYMAMVTKDFEPISQDLWAYVRASAKGRGAKAMDRKRQELARTVLQAKNNLSSVPAYQGSVALKQAMGSYYHINLLVLNGDYAKIMDLEAIAEDSYDLMEAYLKAKDIANEKLDSAYQMFDMAFNEFAAQHEVTIVDGNSKTGLKLKRAKMVYNYYNPIFLLVFKAMKQEAYVMEAMNQRNPATVEQSRETLLRYAQESQQALQNIGAFGGDNSLKGAAQELLNFYKVEAEKLAFATEYYMKQAELEKSTKKIEARQKSGLTKEEVDAHNQLINEMNAMVKKFNELNNLLNTKRSEFQKKWNDAGDSFQQRHIL